MKLSADSHSATPAVWALINAGWKSSCSLAACPIKLTYLRCNHEESLSGENLPGSSLLFRCLPQPVNFLDSVRYKETWGWLTTPLFIKFTPSPALSSPLWREVKILGAGVGWRGAGKYQMEKKSKGGFVKWEKNASQNIMDVWCFTDKEERNSLTGA